jgi:hypothetical protein
MGRFLAMPALHAGIFLLCSKVDDRVEPGHDEKRYLKQECHALEPGHAGT